MNNAKMPNLHARLLMAGTIAASAILAPSTFSHAGYDDQSPMARESAVLNIKRVEDQFSKIGLRIEETSEQIRSHQEEWSAEQSANSFSRIHAFTQVSSGVWTVLMDYVTEALEILSGNALPEDKADAE